MSNNTTTPTFASSAYYGYIFQGSLLFLSNGLILGAILKHAPLRQSKEYLVLGALALTDFCHALGLIIGGTYRTWLITQGQAAVLVSSWDCLMTLHNWIWIWTPQAQDYMLLGVTLDRLLMTLVPVNYLGWTGTYAHILLGAILGSVGAVGLGAIVASYNEPRTQQYMAICFTSWAIGNAKYNTFRDTLQAIALFTSIGLYPLIPIVYYLYALAEGPNNELAVKLRRQRRLVVTVGMCVSCTLVFDAVPKLSRIWMNTGAGARFASMIVPFGVLMHNMNSLANLFFYTVRHRDMRTGIIYFLKCKELPPNFNQNWNPRQN